MLLACCGKAVGAGSTPPSPTAILTVGTQDQGRTIHLTRGQFIEVALVVPARLASDHLPWLSVSTTDTEVLQPVPDPRVSGHLPLMTSLPVLYGAYRAEVPGTATVRADRNPAWSPAAAALQSGAELPVPFEVTVVVG